MRDPTSRSSKTVVVVGASNNPERASHVFLARMLQRGGYRPVPVNPALSEIEGLAVVPSLAQVEVGPEVVSLYLGAARSTALAEDLIRLKPGKVIFNPGAENPDLESALNRAGIETENACSLVLLSQRAL